MSDILNKYLLFDVGKETYALNAENVHRVEWKQDSTEVPNTSEEIKGIITVEEHIVPLFDLRVKFNLKYDNGDENIKKYIIITRIKEKDIIVGLIVDRVIEVIDIPEDVELGNINETITGKNINFIHGIYRPNRDGKQSDKEDKNSDQEKLYILLDIEKLFERDEDKIKEITNE